LFSWTGPWLLIRIGGKASQTDQEQEKAFHAKEISSAATKAKIHHGDTETRRKLWDKKTDQKQ
jgi:hypothetical protein